MKTYMAKAGEVQAHWFVVDAADKVVGRLASDIAMVLMGKHRPTYTPHVDTGDYVVVVNADKIAFTGKWERRNIAGTPAIPASVGKRPPSAEPRAERITRPCAGCCREQAGHRMIEAEDLRRSGTSAPAQQLEPPDGLRRRAGGGRSIRGCDESKFAAVGAFCTDIYLSSRAPPLRATSLGRQKPEQRLQWISFHGRKA